MAANPGAELGMHFFHWVLLQVFFQVCSALVGGKKKKREIKRKKKLDCSLLLCGLGQMWLQWGRPLRWLSGEC